MGLGEVRRDETRKLGDVEARQQRGGEETWKHECTIMICSASRSSICRASLQRNCQENVRSLPEKKREFFMARNEFMMHQSKKRCLGRKTSS